MKERQFTVLIAASGQEDLAAIRETLTRDPSARYAVIEAEDGARALELRRERMPDCVIIDRNLADIAALEALKKLAAGDESRACGIVMLIDEGDARLAVEAMKSGAHDCLEKSRARGEELLRAVSYAIGKAERQRRGAESERLAADEARQVAKAAAAIGSAAGSRPERVDHKRADEQLRLLKAAIEQSSESVFITTSQLDWPGPQIVYVNSAFTKMTGYAFEDVVGKSPRILQGPKTDLAVIERLCKNCEEGRTFFGEAINYRKDGSEFYVEWSIGPVRNERGEVTYFVATQRDVTERRRMEEELRWSEKEFRSLFELSAIGMAKVSPEGRYLRVNRKLCQITRYSEQELLHLTIHDLTHPDDRERSAAELRSSYVGAPDEYSIEKRYVRKDGSIIWVLINWTVVRDAEGRPLRSVANAQDITERKQAEEALQVSEERLSLALEAGDIGTFDWDIRADSVVLTERLTSMFGLPPDKTRGTYEDWRNRVHPEDLPISEANLREVFEKRLPHMHGEYRIIHGDTGEARWIDTHSHIFYDEQGAPLRVIGGIMDITERKRAEQALRESESRLRQLADAMPQIVYTGGPEGRADYANRQWYEYSGVSDQRDITETWMETIHPDDRGQAYQHWLETVTTGKPFDVEYRMRRKDGQYRWHLCRATTIRDQEGRMIRWIGTSTDIHDRKQAEAEREMLLARAEAARAEAEEKAEKIRRLQLVTDASFSSMSLDDLLREMLRNIRTMLEADSATILLLSDDGQSLVVRAMIGSGDEEIGQDIPVGRGVAGSIAESRAPLVVEDLSAIEVVNPSLRRNVRSLIGAPLIVEGRLMGVIHAETIQTRRFTEDDVRLLQLAADRIALALEQARLYEGERQARRQAEEANRSKDEFLAVVSHELRSPLNAMLGYAVLLRHGGLDAKKAKEAAEVIERSGKAQAQLIDDLLDTARIISGKLRLDIGPTDLVAVIEDAVQTIHSAANAKGLSLLTDLSPEVGQITGDPIRLQQIVWNLLTNAVKFTPQGGQVQVRLERIDPHICITVSDTGRGIPAEFLPYVFDRFRQADTSSARRYGGLGLGLALVKYLVELHGGTIEAISEGEGRGTTFKILLPVRAIATPVGEAGGGAVTVQGLTQEAMLAGVRALVVDDEDDARDLVRMVLSQYGAEVVAASSAAEAYEMITTTPPQEQPDVMVTDIGMPDEDGYVLMRRLRAWEREGGLHIPAVALTAYGRVEDRVRALNAGFQMHVTKPVEPAELAAVIASLFRRVDIGENS
ncbi:MAG TPA: PAS domain S-box protein [Blastocatellia bacterium]|nr:PAS domain S-box protein [Blastocatellia bacterium]